MPLIVLLLQDVTTVSRFGKASLEIEFGSAGMLVIEAEDDVEFESYSIYLDSGDVIVV